MFSKTINLLKIIVSTIKFLFGSSRPFSGPVKVHWDLEYKCNSRCIHCLRWKINHNIKNQLNTDEARALINQIKELGVFNLSFAGNEPLIRDDIYELIKYAKNIGLNTSLNTNALLLDKENCKRLIDAGIDMIYLSLDGSNPEINDKIRGISGSYDKVLESIKYLKLFRRRGQRQKKKPKIMFNTVINKLNYNDIENILELTRELEIDGILFQPLHNVEAYFQPSVELSLNENQIKELNKKLRIIVKKYSDLIPLTPEYFYNFRTFFTNKDQLYKYRCSACFFTLDIRPNGDVVPCPVYENVIGNVRESSLKEIWKSKKASTLRKEIKNNKHPVCWFACIIPINIMFHNISHFRLNRISNWRFISHIINKI